MIIKYQRNLWAMNGIHEKNFEFKTVIDIYTKYERLNLVPTHYDFPEFYRY